MTDIAMLHDVQRRLREADKPNFELDVAIHAALRPDSMQLAPPYTASLDACAALQEARLPGWTRNAGTFEGQIGASVALYPPGGHQEIGAAARTEPLAWLLAIVAAVIAEETQ